MNTKEFKYKGQKHKGIQGNTNLIICLSDNCKQTSPSEMITNY